MLTVSPGDTIHTTTVDAGGTDEKGVRRVLGGNPETGPFYVESAVPGDTLVVHIVHLKLNRDWAISDDGIVPRGMDSDLAVKLKDAGKTVRWHLDAAQRRGVTGKTGRAYGAIHGAAATDAGMRGDGNRIGASASGQRRFRILRRQYGLQ